jgi:hypothetical protein
MRRFCQDPARFRPILRFTPGRAVAEPPRCPSKEADMDEDKSSVLPDGVREGDVLVYMSGRLLVVDHLVPEAFTLDLVEMHEADVVRPATQ